MSKIEQFLEGVSRVCGPGLLRRGFQHVPRVDKNTSLSLSVRFESGDDWVVILWDPREEDVEVRVGPVLGRRWGDSLGVPVTELLREQNCDVDKVLARAAKGLDAEIDAYAELIEMYLESLAPHREKMT